MSDRDSLSASQSAQPSALPSGCAGAILWAGLAAVLSVAITAVAVLLLQSRISADARAGAEAIASRFEAAFNFRPEIRIDGVVVIESRSPVLEIATAQSQILVRHRWTHTHLLSTKTLEIEAPFTVKAGFDLREEPLRISIDPATGSMRTDFPRPRILSLEMGDPRMLRDEDGLWNKLTPADREEAFRALRRLAREETEKSRILHDAKAEAEARIRELLYAKDTPSPPGSTPRP